MDYSLQQLFLIATGYLMFLFLVAWVTEKGWIPARIVRHPMVYVFSLMVYASAWAVYGSVGYAAHYGYNFLAYFLGISGVFLLAPILLAPILKLTATYQLNSLADLFAFRFRSRAVGTLTTLLMVTGMLPLLSLQIKAVAESIQILTGEHNADALAFWFCALILLFSILFGARHATARDKHEGLVVAIATESAIKLVAFILVALYGLFAVHDGPSGLSQWLLENPDKVEALYKPLNDGTWHSLILAFFVSAVVMPHMFYMAFTENMNPRALMTASWALPLLMLIMALCVPVIMWSSYPDPAIPPDYYVLGLGRPANGHTALLGYLAGLAGASGMLIVTTLALSAMCLNHLVLPLARPHRGEDLYRWLLWTKRILIAAILILAYLFFSASGNRLSLAELGVLSFVATLQFVPGLIGLLFWPRANRFGFFLGIVGGFFIWTFALVLPLISSLPELPWLSALLQLQEPLPNHWHHIALVSVSLNGVLLVIGSILTPSSPAEMAAAETCAVDSLRRPFRWELEASNVDDFIAALARPLGPMTARREVELALTDLRLTPAEARPYALRRLRDQLETNLSGLLGPSVAHQIVDDVLPYKPQEEPSGEDIQFIESRLEQYRNRLSGLAGELDSLRRFHRQTLYDLPIGVISLGADGEILGWNQAIEDLTGIAGQDTVGSRLQYLPAPWGTLFFDFLQSRSDHAPQQPIQLDNKTRWISLHQSAIQGDKLPNQSSGQVLVVEDVTDLHVLESQLAHNERLASIGRLAAGVAHEIGNPVTAIACLTQNLASLTSLDDHDAQELEEAATQILEQTRRITRIVESLVTFSHSGQTGDSVHMMTVHIHDIVSEAIALLQLDPEHKQQLFHNHTQRAHQVTADPQRLLQVFVNLLTNAADASDDTLPVTVSSDLIDTSSGSRMIQISIEDHGHGIPAALKESLFEPFVTSKPPGQGTGLGLALVYSIIEQHQGNILIESPITEDQQGTRFVITLPHGTTPDDITRQDTLEPL